MKLKNIIFLVIVAIQLVVCKRIRKRQIYREQVQPHTGGKIPDSAFETDRLLLNRLQKEGIAIPDGIVLEQRNPKVFPYSHNDLRPVFKVLATSDNRFTDISGGVFNTMPLSDTTYPIPRITEDSLPQVPIQTTVYQPIYRPFLLPNPYLHNPALGNNNMAALPQKNYFTRINQLTPQSHTFKYFYEDYVTSQIFDELSKFVGSNIPFGAPLR